MSIETNSNSPEISIHDEMLASISRTAFLGVNSPRIPPINENGLDSRNKRILAEQGEHPVLTIVGPDAISVDGRPVTQFTTAGPAELLGYYAATKSMKTSEYYDMGLFREAGDPKTRKGQMERSRQFLINHLVTQDGFPLVLKSGNGRSTRSGIPYTVVVDLRRTGSYHRARQQQMAKLVENYIVDGDLVPDYSEVGGMIGAKQALQKVAQRLNLKELDDDQKERFRYVSIDRAQRLSTSGESNIGNKVRKARHRRSIHLAGLSIGETPKWVEKANCNIFTAHLFSPDHNENQEEKLSRDKKAKAICSGCEVEDLCRDAAVRAKEYDKGNSIWGGMNKDELRAYAKRAR